MNWTVISLALLAVACFYAAYLHIKLRDTEEECNHLKTLLPKHGKDGRFVSRK